MTVTALARNFDGNPNIVTMVTTSTNTDITTTGWFILPATIADIELLQNGEFQTSVTDLWLIYYATGIGFYTLDSTTNAFVALTGNAGLSTTLSNGDIFVGNASNVATGVPVSGILAITNAGVTSIPLPSADLLVGSAGGVATARAMSGIVAISNTGVTSIPLVSAHILVGSGGGVAADVAMTGAITITNAGVTSITAGTIVNADINAAAAIAFSKLATLASTNILVGSAGGVATSVAMTGDVTIGNTGVTAIGANKVLSSMISPLVEKYVAVAMTAAEFNGMYAAPKLLLAAGGANTLIVVKRAVLAMTFVSAAFANGGVVGLQYDNTVHGAGVAATNTEAAADFFAAASTAFQFEGVSGNTVAISPFTTTVNKGIYISNLTGAFDTGDNTFVVHLWYSVIPTV